MFLTEEERSIRNIERILEKLNLELSLLKLDLSVVYSEKAKEMISDEIASILRYKDRKEFELWKLKK